MDMDLRRFGLPSRGAMEEDDGVLELSLGLSIGGSSRKARRSVPGLGSGEEGTDHGGSGASVPPLLLPFPGGDLTNCLDLQRRREVHAVRRQEARKERHGKQPLEAQEEGRGVRDREAREEEARHSDRRAGENHGPGSDPVADSQLCPSSNGNPNAGANCPNFANQDLPPLGAPHPFPVVAMQCPYPPVQYVPMPNGFGIPYMMPCWAPAMPSVTGGPNPASDLFQPVTRRTFQPDAEPSNIGASPLSSKMVDLLSAGEYMDSEGIERAPSCTGSLGSNNSSSAISTDYQSDSLQGGSSGSSDSRSHSSVAPAESSYHPHMSNLVQGQSEHSVSSRRIEPEADAVEAPSKKRPTPYAPSSNPTPTLCAPAKLERVISVNKPVPAADEPIPPPPSSPLPRMPCVSTTGNGPNGRTITGFLYRYTSMEVSIVCVCHGSSFSPAGFVKHAGGTDTANPLKHIIVVPS